MEKPQIIVLNKVDLLPSQELPREIKLYYRLLGKPYVAISALTGIGVDTLLAIIGESLGLSRSTE